MEAHAEPCWEKGVLSNAGRQAAARRDSPLWVTLRGRRSGVGVSRSACLGRVGWMLPFPNVSRSPRSPPRRLDSQLSLCEPGVAGVSCGVRPCGVLLPPLLGHH
eukprot:1568307-Pyramimonas_sp.AAC.4